MKVNVYQIRYRSRLEVSLIENIVAATLDESLRTFRAVFKEEKIESITTIAEGVNWTK